jgi:hypothetical protein
LLLTEEAVRRRAYRGAGTDSAQLRRLVELQQEAAEPREARWAELLCPRGLHFADRLADHANRGGAPSGEGDAPGAQVVGVWSALEVAEAFKLAEKVVEGLFADPQPDGQFGGPRTLRSWVLEDVQVRRIEVDEQLAAMRAGPRVRGGASSGPRLELVCVAAPASGEEQPT